MGVGGLGPTFRHFSPLFATFPHFSLLFPTLATFHYFSPLFHHFSPLVIPIYKKGDKSNFANYRPISILPAFSKIFEKLAYNRIINFVAKHNILSDNQYGFRKGRSTDTAIHHALVEKFYETVENDDIMIGLFIDFSRAFDTISHNVLLQKLYHYGFRAIALDWSTNYLYNRKQFVMYNNVK